MILISHRWSHHANHWYQNPTQRGLLTGITCPTNDPNSTYSAHTGQSPTPSTNTPYRCTHMSSNSYSRTTHSRTPQTWTNITHSLTYRS